MKRIINIENNLYSQIASIIHEARSHIISTINQTITRYYFEIGKLIVNHEQKGEKRAKYGKRVLIELSRKLTKEFGRGFSERNLEQMRQFYLSFSKSQTVSAKLEKQISFPLSWSHYVLLMRIDNTEERQFYEIECTENNWSVRELIRQFNSALYERLALSRNKGKLKELSSKGQIFEKPEDALKDPYVLEFLGIDEKSDYRESDLEKAIITHLEKFLLELGKGFFFVARQKRFSFDHNHYYIDLVFYNRILKCFILIDLKIGELTHQDIGQMQMYVNIFDRKIKSASENPTIGIILCREKNNVVVEFTLPKNNNQIFARKYMLYLPSKKELKKQIAQIYLH